MVMTHEKLDELGAELARWSMRNRRLTDQEFGDTSKEYDWHNLIIPMTKWMESWRKIQNWCMFEAEGLWYSRKYSDGVVFRFTSKHDCMMFKLTWGGTYWEPPQRWLP